MELSEIKQIKELLDHGYDIEIISMEMGITTNQIREYCKVLENDFSKNTQNNIKNSKLKGEMNQLRERYKKIYWGTEEIKIQPSLSEQQLALINNTISTSKKYIERFGELTEIQQVNNICSIIREINCLSNLPLSIEQAEELYEMLQLEKFSIIRKKEMQKIVDEIRKTKMIVLKKLLEAVDYAQTDTNEIDGLKKLQRRLTKEMLQEQPILAGRINSKIENKILKLRQRQTIARVKSEIPENIQQVVKKLELGTADIEDMQKIIEDEVEIRERNKRRNKFALTREHIKEQILSQTRRALVDSKVNIENPENTVVLLKELYGGNLELALETVVDHLINNKKFEEAKIICDRFDDRNKYRITLKFLQKIRRNIKNAKIGDFILNEIQNKGTKEEDSRHYRMIYNDLKMGKIKSSEIPLGKSKDGLRTIYLSDIWEEKQIIK